MDTLLPTVYFFLSFFFIFIFFFFFFFLGGGGCLVSNLSCFSLFFSAISNIFLKRLRFH